MFELVFDYGDHDTDAPTPTAAGHVVGRGDAFSTYRPGFEIRTYRLCRRVLMFHHFPTLGAAPTLCAPLTSTTTRTQSRPGSPRSYSAATSAPTAGGY